MNKQLLQKARTRRIEALWTKRVKARLTADVAAAAAASMASAQKRVTVFGAHC